MVDVWPAAYPLPSFAYHRLRTPNLKDRLKTPNCWLTDRLKRIFIIKEILSCVAKERREISQNKGRLLTVEPDKSVLSLLYYILSPQGSYPILTLTLSDKNISSFYSEAELLSETSVELLNFRTHCTII